MMKRRAYIIILYLILLMCVKEIRGDAEEKEEDGTIDNINTSSSECQSNTKCEKKLSGLHSDLGKLKDGIGIGNALGDLLKEAVKKGQMNAFALQMADIAGKASLALPVIGPLVALVTGFLPSTESQQIEELRVSVQHGFTVVNNKLQDVMNKMDHVEIICKSEAYITRVHRDKTTITNARETVRRWVEDTVTQEQLAGYTRAVVRMDGDAINNAAQNLQQSISSGEFAAAIIDAENSNRENINGKLKQMYSLIYAGAESYLIWLKVKGKDGDPDYNDGYIDKENARWSRTLLEVKDAIVKFDEDTFTTDWKTKYKNDYKRIAAGGGTCEALVEKIHTFLTGKYDWLHTFVIVHKHSNLSEWKEGRYWKRCKSHTYAETDIKGKTFVVGYRDLSDSVDAGKNMNDLHNFYTTYRYLTIYREPYTTAYGVWNTNNQTVGMCTDFSIKGVMKSSIELHMRSLTGIAHRKNIGTKGWDYFKL